MRVKELTIVTGNGKKFAQMSAGFSSVGIESKQANIDLEEIQTLDAVEVVKRKALDAYAQVNGPVAVDDGGIYFDTYNQFPGVYAKFVFQSLGFAGLEKLYAEGDAATFRSHVCYYDEQLATEGADPMIFIGEYPGTLTHHFENREETVMPYAEFFVPMGAAVPLSRMRAEERVNDHRQQAVRACAQWISNK